MFYLMVLSLFSAMLLWLTGFPKGHQIIFLLLLLQCTRLENADTQTMIHTHRPPVRSYGLLWDTVFDPSHHAYPVICIVIWDMLYCINANVSRCISALPLYWVSLSSVLFTHFIICHQPLTSATYSCSFHPVQVSQPIPITLCFISRRRQIMMEKSREIEALRLSRE